MIRLKTKKEIGFMLENGQALAGIRDFLQNYCEPGITLNQVEAKSQELIKKAGGEPGFAKVPGYRWATCLNVNDSFVHGIPSDYIMQPGDVVTIDIGMFKYGFHTDTATSFVVGVHNDLTRQKKIEKFLHTGQITLANAIKTAKCGHFVGHISAAIQQGIEKEGYTVARTLTGHGVGWELHEAPKIPCFLSGEVAKTEPLKPGMTLAIEVLYLEGKADIMTDIDGWTIRSKDGRITSVFEKTIALQDDGCIVLT